MPTSVDEAIKDVEALREASVKVAKERLVEQFAPEIKKIVESEMRRTISEASAEETGKGKNMADDTKSVLDELEPEGEAFAGEETEEEEKKEEEKKDEEKVEEAADKKDDDSIEISEAALKKVYEEALQLEAQVSKGFKDMTAAGELDDVKPGDGIADVKSGEVFHDQKGALPPARKDWTIKEIRSLVEQGMAENAALKAKNKKLVEAAGQLFKKLQEVNLFNAKVMVANRFLAKNGKLTVEQKKTVLAAIDEAKTIAEAKRAAALVESMIKQPAQISEGRKPQLSTAAKPTGILAENAAAKPSTNPTFSRWGLIAGLGERK